MKQYPNIAIIILNYNGRDVLDICLSSVFGVNYPNFSVVVVDNNSNDGSLELAKNKFPKAIFIKNEQNLGFAAGNNVGIKFALEHGAGAVLLLNNDTKVAPNFLLELAEAVGEDKSIGVASPIIFVDNSRKIWFSGGKIDWIRMKTKHFSEIKKEKVYTSSFITGCAMLITKKVFKKIGLLDEDFFLYWEDADFSVRARKAGFRCVVVSDSKVNHYEKSEGNKENKVYWLVVSGLMFFKKNSPRWLSLWISGYVLLRKIKNFMDRKLGKNNLAMSVGKAYRDFKKYAATRN
jgi:hypothetical protein